jgi:thermitase
MRPGSYWKAAAAVFFAMGVSAQTVGYVPGRLLVKFRAGTGSERAVAALAAVGARDAGAVGNAGVRVVTLPAAADERAMLNVLRQRGEVEFAELDAIVAPEQLTPNDPWYTYNGGHLRKIEAPMAWTVTKGARVVIAILDTGVDGTHEDLGPRLVAGWNTYRNNSDSRDTFGHGTQVAAAAAAATDNGLGNAGVCWDCYIMPVRISADDGTATYSAAAAAITWAADRGARVANVSYMMTGSATVAAAAQYMWDRGGVVTVSSGNYGTFDSKGDVKPILTVGAVDGGDALYSWSNRGNHLDLVGPGCVTATARMGGGYTSACGTSFSAPVVAGVAALVVAANPGLTAQGITDALLGTAEDLGAAGWDSSYGWGRVNAYRAVQRASGGTNPPAPDTEAPTVTILTPGAGATVSGTVNVQVAAADNAGVTAVELSVDGQAAATLTAAPYVWNWPTQGVGNGSHTLTARAFDAARNSAAAGVAVTVMNSVDTQPPSVAVAAPSAGAKLSPNTTVSANASDNVGVSRVEFYVNGGLIGTATAAPYTIRWNTQKLGKGTHSLTCRAVDVAGNAATAVPVAVYK